MASDWMNFFFEYMSGPNSYAGGGKARPINSMSGWKSYDNEHGPYRLLDRYAVLPDGFSSGITTLWDGEHVRMLMTYGGFYPKEVTPFLRRVLKMQYQAQEFNGFRGPTEFVEGEYVYCNIQFEVPMWVGALNTTLPPIYAGQYKQSAGREMIQRNQKEYPMVGWHDYHYMIFTHRT